MHPLARYVSTVLAFVLTIYLVPGISAPGGWIAVLLVALVWSAITLVIKPVLSILSLPITILTFGLFALVLNALLFWLTAGLVPGFVVAGFWSAFVGALVLSVLTWLINLVLSE